MKGRGTSFCRRSVESPTSDLITGMIIGCSPAMQNVISMVRQVAMYPSTTILLQGESGTGKEVVAHAIHELSSRAAYQFMPINCAALPDTLLETELFGVEAGAYTDAKMSREGYLLRADGGTLFLDEIGSMPLLLQAKLLRFLETRSFRRVGSTKEIHVDLRVIAATNTDLPSAVLHKTFRDDLFYRLNVITIPLAPLRERPEDIDLLVEHFLKQYTSERTNLMRMSLEAMELLRRYHWPGNIRELRNVIERSLTLCDDQEILPAHFPEDVCNAGKSASQRLYELQEQMHLPADGLDLTAFMRNLERTFVREALERCNGNQVQAAALLGISRDQLRYRLSR